VILLAWLAAGEQLFGTAAWKETQKKRAGKPRPTLLLFLNQTKEMLNKLYIVTVANHVKKIKIKKNIYLFDRYCNDCYNIINLNKHKELSQ